MPDQITTSTIIYLLILAITIYTQHHLLAHRWRKHELARRALGIITVFLLALPLVVLGQLDWWTWATLLTAFSLAGAITTALYTDQAARQTDVTIQLLKTQLGAYDETTGQTAQPRARFSRK